MKYIKNFELVNFDELENDNIPPFNLPPIYIVNDYVLLKTDEDWGDYFNSEVSLYCKIGIVDAATLNFYVESYFIHSGEEFGFWTNYYNIERKMTEEEIKDYNTKKYAYNYNL